MGTSRDELFTSVTRTQIVMGKLAQLALCVVLIAFFLGYVEISRDRHTEQTAMYSCGAMDMFNVASGSLKLSRPIPVSERCNDVRDPAKKAGLDLKDMAAKAGF